MIAYLDNSATTRPSRAVAEAVEQWMDGGWYNPSALYKPAMEIQKQVDEVRRLCMHALDVPDGRVIFTSGGTEADNLAILGYLRGKRGGRVLFSSVEHPAVSSCAEEIRRLGFTAEEIPSSSAGTVDLEALENMMDDQVVLIAVMQVNNETGAVEPLERISELRKRLCPDAVFHVDGVQGFLRMPVSFRKLGLQSYALSAHKIQGLKGTGALVTVKNHPLHPILYGGGQEGNLRSGTENTFGILALGKAISQFDPESNEHMRMLKNRLWSNIHELIPEAQQNGPEDHPEHTAPHILNAAFEPVRSQTMLFALEGDGIFVSAGSACASRKQKISPVLRAMGIPTQQADCSLRFSLSPETTAEEVDYAAERAAHHYRILKKFTRR